MITVGQSDLLQYTLIRLVQGFWKLVKGPPDALRKTMLQHFQLAEYPSEPVGWSVSVIDTLIRLPHIPSALPVSVLTTSSVSLSLHLFIAVSESA